MGEVELVHAREGLAQLPPDGEAVARVARRGLQRARQAELAEALGEHAPAADAARHGDGVDAVARHRLVAQRLIALDGRRARGASAGVQPDQRARGGVPDDGEEVAAQPADEGIDDLERGVGGDRRVHRVAASLEHVEAGLRGERMRRGDQPVGGQCLGAMLWQRA